MKIIWTTALAFIVSAVGFASTASAEEVFARAYASHNYQGPPSLKIYPNQLWLAHSGNYWNDQIDSVKVPEGCVLIVREHSHRNAAGSLNHGAVARITENVRNMRRVYDSNGKSWHDRISYMLLRC